MSFRVAVPVTQMTSIVVGTIFNNRVMLFGAVIGWIVD